VEPAARLAYDDERFFEETMRTAAVLVAGFGLVSATLGAAMPRDPQAVDARQVPGTFRSGVTMVPIDVRVLGEQGYPVTDLTLDDFTVFEDGVPQEIQHFLRLELVAGTPTPILRPLRPRALALDAPTAPDRRVFLIVLGRGRQDGPVKVLDALLDFVDRRLLPQDQVAVLAYNRAMAFTTAHEDVARVLARYQDQHTEIEALLAQRLSGLSGLYDRDVPPSLQRRIDALFGLSGGLLREVSEHDAAALAAIEEDLRRTGDELQRAALVDDRAEGLPDLTAALTADLVDMSFDDYIERSVTTEIDVSNIVKGIEYLRYIEGEKHLLYITHSGFGLRSADEEDSLAARAADARVAIDAIHTSGVVAAPKATPTRMSAVPTAGQVFRQTFSVKGMRAVADLTGGQAWAFQPGEHALTRLDRATRFQYLLGYISSNGDWDGGYREIKITVSRPRVKVLHRRGYYSTLDAGPDDPGGR
jgi:VWFA-related protein